MNLQTRHALIALSLSLTANALACSTNSSNEKPLEERTAKTKQAIGVPLPVRDFVQLPNLCPGSVHDLVTFDSGTVLVATVDTIGRMSLAVHEPNGPPSPLAGPTHYVRPLAKVEVTGHRIACTMRASLIQQGPGPVGTVYTFDRTQGTEVVCWYSPNGSTTWTEKVIASAAPGEPKDAFWPVFYSDADINKVPVPNAFEVVYVRDADYAFWANSATGRASREGTFFVRVDMPTGNITLIDQDTYPDWRDDARSYLGPLDCAGRCGWSFNGIDWTDCGGCAGGLHCDDGACGPIACTPKTAADACIDKPDAQACGERTDGCGGKVTCAACPAGQVCGGGGKQGYCGTRSGPMTAKRVRKLYNDTNNLLCGTLPDPLSGVPVVMTSTCNNCVDNVCRDTPLPACIPSGGLVNSTP